MTPTKPHLADLKPHQCRWPLEGEKADTVFCGARRKPGKPYCAEHARKAYVEMKS